MRLWIKKDLNYPYHLGDEKQSPLNPVFPPPIHHPSINTASPDFLLTTGHNKPLAGVTCGVDLYRRTVLFSQSENLSPSCSPSPSITHHQRDVYFPTPCCWLCCGWFNKLREIGSAGCCCLTPARFSHTEHMGAARRAGCGAGGKWLPGGSAAASRLKMFDCGNLLCVQVITHRAVHQLLFVHDWVNSVRQEDSTWEDRRN